jgi:uncharacterized membrane protein
MGIQLVSIIIFCFACSTFLALRIKLPTINNLESIYNNLDRFIPPILFTIFSIYFTWLLNKSNQLFIANSYYTNMVWNLSQFSFQYSASDLDIPTSIFGTHINFILLPVALIYKLIPTDLTLFVIQSAIICSVVFPISYISKKITKSSLLGILASLSFLLHPSIQIGHKWGIVVDLWAAAFMLWAIFFYYKQNIKLFFLFTVLAIFCKEIIAVSFFGLGLWLFINDDNKKLSIQLIIFSVIIFYILIVMKNYFNNGYDVHVDYSQKLKFLLSNPYQLILHYINPWTILTVLLLLIPFGLLSLANPSSIIAILPYLAILFLNNDTLLIKNYYHAPVLPLLLLGALHGVNRLFVDGPWRKISLNYVLLFWGSIMFLFTFFYNPYGFPQKKPITFNYNKPHTDLVINKLKNIPQQYTVSSTLELQNYINKRKYYYIFPRAIVREELYDIFQIARFKNPYTRDAEFVVIDLLQPSVSEYFPGTSIIRDLINDSDYSLEYFNDGLLIMKRNQLGETKYNNIYFDKKVTKSNLNKIDYSDNISLREITIHPADIVSIGTGLSISILWEKKLDEIDDFRVLLRFKKSSKKIMEWIHEPLFGLIPPNEWKKEFLIQDNFIIPISSDFQSGNVPYEIDIEILWENNMNNINTNIEDIKIFKPIL